jgi:prephenate dehydratase
MYDLEILAPEIQTIKNNMTRLSLLKENSFLAEEDINRALKFELIINVAVWQQC